MHAVQADPSPHAEAWHFVKFLQFSCFCDHFVRGSQARAEDLPFCFYAPWRFMELVSLERSLGKPQIRKASALRFGSEFHRWCNMRLSCGLQKGWRLQKWRGNAQQAFCLESNQKRQIAVTLIKYSLALALVFLRSKIKLLDYFNDACE